MQSWNVPQDILSIVIPYHSETIHPRSLNKHIIIWEMHIFANRSLLLCKHLTWLAFTRNTFEAIRMLASLDNWVVWMWYNLPNNKPEHRNFIRKPDQPRTSQSVIVNHSLYMIWRIVCANELWLLEVSGFMCVAFFCCCYQNYFMHSTIVIYILLLWAMVSAFHLAYIQSTVEWIIVLKCVYY